MVKTSNFQLIDIVKQDFSVPRAALGRRIGVLNIKNVKHSSQIARNSVFVRRTIQHYRNNLKIMKIRPTSDLFYHQLSTLDQGYDTLVMICVFDMSCREMAHTRCDEWGLLLFIINPVS